MDEETARSDRLIAGLRAGDAAAEFEFWRQYGDALHRLADRHLAAGLRARIGPEDVVQSACRTFLRRAQAGQFQMDDCAGLWRVLCAITLTKVREQARFHLRQKRGLGRETTAPAGDSASAVEPAAPGPTPAEAVVFADQFQHLLASLDDEERAIVELKLQDFTNDQVAEQLGSSERTIRRILKRMQSRLMRLLDAEGDE